MWRAWQRLTFLAVSLWLSLAACASPGPFNHTRQEIFYEQGKLQKFAYVGDLYTPPGQPPARSPFFDALDVLRTCDPEALPQLADLPQPPPVRHQTRYKYTGIIRNFSPYHISIPSASSGATLIVPAHGWIEYEAWQQKIKLAGFVNGKQVYHQVVHARPQQYEYFGNRYDFVATIQPEPEAPPAKPSPSPRRKPRRAQPAK